jgi:hypothetical protein
MGNEVFTLEGVTEPARKWDPFLPTLAWTWRRKEGLSVLSGSPLTEALQAGDTADRIHLIPLPAPRGMHSLHRTEISCNRERVKRRHIYFNTTSTFITVSPLFFLASWKDDENLVYWIGIRAFQSWKPEVLKSRGHFSFIPKLPYVGIDHKTSHKRNPDKRFKFSGLPIFRILKSRLRS